MIPKNIIPGVVVCAEETDDIVVEELPRSYFNLKKRKKKSLRKVMSNV